MCRGSPSELGGHNRGCAFRDRAARLAGDILDFSDFFLADDQLSYDEKAFDKRLRKPLEAAPLLRTFWDRLRDADAFDAGSANRASPASGASRRISANPSDNRMTALREHALPILPHYTPDATTMPASP